MKLTRLTIQHLRNHESYTCDFGAHATLIYGANGTGKTTLLEAVYMGLRGVSFKGVDRDIVQRETDWYRINLESDEDVRTIKYDGAKRIEINGKTHARLPAKSKYPVVLFTPDDMRLVDGSPSRRRKYLDSFLAQFDPKYAHHLRRYERALVQRNKLLKSPRVSEELLFSWNVMLSDSGAYLINQRIKFVAAIETELAAQYAAIAADPAEIHASYTVEKPITSQQLLAAYEQSIERDRALLNTSVGPHRHDFLITLRTHAAATSASRGEIRTIILALKYIEAATLERATGKRPIILLDDVYGELDETRQRHLLSSFHDHQIIITSTHTVPLRGAVRVKI
jgi:DNA replication and repair protein RecF